MPQGAASATSQLLSVSQHSRLFSMVDGVHEENRKQLLCMTHSWSLFPSNWLMPERIQDSCKRPIYPFPGPSIDNKWIVRALVTNKWRLPTLSLYGMWCSTSRMIKIQEAKYQKSNDHQTQEKSITGETPESHFVTTAISCLHSCSRCQLLASRTRLAGPWIECYEYYKMRKDSYRWN